MVNSEIGDGFPDRFDAEERRRNIDDATRRSKSIARCSWRWKRAPGSDNRVVSARDSNNHRGGVAAP